MCVALQFMRAAQVGGPLCSRGCLPSELTTKRSKDVLNPGTPHASSSHCSNRMTKRALPSRGLSLGTRLVSVGIQQVGRYLAC